VQWGGGELLQVERRPPPFTGETFWEACKTYFPPELLTPAATFLLRLSSSATKQKTKAPRGIGQRVQTLMTGPLKMEQGMARRFIAVGLCKCLDEAGFRTEPCRCGAYERVTKAHKQWRSDRRKGKSGGVRQPRSILTP
jgi:hypothetical protein